MALDYVDGSGQLQTLKTNVVEGEHIQQTQFVPLPMLALYDSNTGGQNAVTLSNQIVIGSAIISVESNATSLNVKLFGRLDLEHHALALVKLSDYSSVTEITEPGLYSLAVAPGLNIRTNVQADAAVRVKAVVQ